MGKIYNALKKSQKNESGLPKSSPDSDHEFSDTEKAEPFLPNPDHDFPSVPTTVDPNLITALKPHSIESEQFRLLKNTILFPENGVPPKTIMVTSTNVDEGKSFITTNLAVSIAQSIDEYVLLIDCDLRRPSIHNIFGYGKTKGLSEYLSEGQPLSSLLLKTFIGKLTLLPGGEIPSNPSELLSSEQMRRLLQEVRLRYADRYVIIDTPPPTMTSETNAIARQVDGIILVVRERKTKVKDIQNIIDIYGREKILGVVQNYSTQKIGLGYGKHSYYDTK